MDYSPSTTKHKTKFNNTQHNKYNMPSRESVSEEIRARTEFATAVRQGIDALMGRCGYSRERATLALLKELNRGSGPESKPTDDEVCISFIRRSENENFLEIVSYAILYFVSNNWFLTAI